MTLRILSRETRKSRITLTSLTYPLIQLKLVGRILKEFSCAKEVSNQLILLPTKNHPLQHLNLYFRLVVKVSESTLLEFAETCENLFLIHHLLVLNTIRATTSFWYIWDGKAYILRNSSKIANKCSVSISFSRATQVYCLIWHLECYFILRKDPTCLFLFDFF